jgi:hypothetical protein
MTRTTASVIWYRENSAVPNLGHACNTTTHAANEGHRVEDIKRVRFIDPHTLVSTNCLEFPTISEQQRKEASAHTRNAHRGEDGGVHGGYLWQARAGPNYDLYRDGSE